MITLENGKTFVEGKAEMRRAIENVEVACGIPLMMQGYNLEDVARGIDEMMIRQPLGVVAAITPFNFPVMVPFWFIPYGIACGNTFIVKPSEKVPLAMRKVFELVEQLGLPPGVLNLVNGAKPAVDTLLDHPQVRAISFVGSTPVAKYIYSRGSNNGKRVQCQGGAKNHVVVLPDADIEMTTQIINDSAFGCAGQRCLAVSVLSLVHAETVDEAIDILSRSAYGNAASIFTSSGAAARKFRYEAPAGNIGVNIGVAAPMAYFPFSGWKDSFLGVLHGQGRDAVEFYTEKKVVIERWPKEWSRKF